MCLSNERSEDSIGLGRKRLEPGTHKKIKRVSIITEDALVVLKQRLDSHTLRLDIRELALDVHRSHNGRSKNHCEIERRHLQSS
jgi:hypothetical protein